LCEEKIILKQATILKEKPTGEWYIDDYNILTSIYGDLKEGKISLHAQNK